MCRFGDPHQTHTQCATEPRNECDFQTPTQVKPNLPRPSTELDLSRSLSVFLFDWDDTLFPTTALASLGPERLGEALNAVDTIVAELLTAVLATPTSRVVILTNARSSWVHHAVQNFMPNVHTLLGAHQDGQLLLLSAHRDRSQFTDAGSYEEAMRSSKCEAVRSLSTALRPVVDELQAQSFQVISVGDQPHDLVAAHALWGLMFSEECGFEQSFVKTIAMKPMPTGVELAKQLGTLCKALPKLLNAARSFHQSMCQARASPTQCRTCAVEASGTSASAETNGACPPAHDALVEVSTLSKSSAVPAQSVPSLSHDTQTVHTSTTLAQPASMSTKDAPPSKGQCENADISGPLSRRDRGNTWQGSAGDEPKEAVDDTGR